MRYEPNRDREQPVEAARDGVLGEPPLAGSMLPVGGPGNDPDTDKVGDEADEVDERGPIEGEGRDASRATAADSIAPAGAAGSSGAPFVAIGLGDATYDDEERERRYGS